MLKAGASLAVVQRMLGHTDPNVTANTYGHLDLDDLRKSVERLSFSDAPVLSESQAEVIPLAANGSREPEVARRGLPVVPQATEATLNGAAHRENHQRSRGVELNGPTRIRTWNLAVMSRQL